MASTNNGGDTVQNTEQMVGTALTPVETPTTEPTHSSATITHEGIDLLEVGSRERGERVSQSSEDTLLPGSVTEEDGRRPLRNKMETSFSNPVVQDAEGESLQHRESYRQDDSQRDQELLERTLHQIARDGNVEIMQKKIALLTPTQLQKKLKTKDVDKLTPLHYAARYNHYGMCMLLVDQGADIHAKGEDDMQPLHLVAKYKQRSKSIYEVDSQPEIAHMRGTPSKAERDNIKILNYLVEKGASVNQKDFYGLTPLHQACLRGNTLFVEALLRIPGIVVEGLYQSPTPGMISAEVPKQGLSKPKWWNCAEMHRNGAPENAMDKQQMTPLHIAAVYGHDQITELLLKNGANIRCKDEENGTPLHLAAGEGNLQIVDALLKAAMAKNPPDFMIDMLKDRDNDGNTPLHLSVDSGHMPITRILLQKAKELGNSDLANVKRADKETPLHLAAGNGHLSIVKLLVNHGARIDKIDDTGSTPLILASKFNHHQIVKYLLNCGAKVDAKDSDEFTALLIAANFGHPETIQLLIDHGADITAVDKQERNVFHQCADEERVDAMQKMLNDNRKDVRELMNLPDRYGNTPLHNAAKRGHFTILKVLLEAGATIDLKNEEEQTPLHLAAIEGRVKVIRSLISHDKSVIHDDDEDANTALHLAALEGRDKCVLALVESGANIGARNVKQWTPLDCCASKGHVRCATVLLDGDSPVDPKDKRSITPLHLACQQGHVDMVKLLLKWEADVSLRSSDGRNALDFAADFGKEDCALAIVESPQWKEALQNRTKDIATGLWTQTPMRKLIRKMPEVAEAVFRNCLRTNNKQQEHRNFQINFDFEFLDDEYACTNWVEQSDTVSEMSVAISSDTSYPVYDEFGKLGPEAEPYSKDSDVLLHNHCLMIMVQSKREQLLRHPLVISLLKYKWRSYGRSVYYGFLLLYTIFMAVFNSYMLTVPAPYAINITTTIADGSCVKVVDAAQQTWGSSCVLQHAFWQPIAQWITIGLAGVGLLKEIFQVFSAKARYFLSLTNWIELAVYILCILTVIDVTDYSANTGVREPWQWQCGAAAVFCSWMGLLLYMQNFPRFGIYILMFTDVFKTFSSFFLVFLLFIFAFAFSFHALFQNQFAFSFWWNSLIKTLVMMIGEFEYDSLFNAQFTSDAYSDQVEYAAVSYIIFVFFLVIMSIIIMNLLVGLAVDDIKEVQDHAELEGLAMQVQLALDVEYTLPKFFRKYFLRKYYDYWPNHYQQYNKILKYFLKDKKLSAESIATALTPEKGELDVIEDKIEDVQKRVQTLRTKVRDVNVRTQSIESMMKAIMEHLKINWSDDQDDQDS